MADQPSAESTSKRRRRRRRRKSGSGASPEAGSWKAPGNPSPTEVPAESRRRGRRAVELGGPLPSIPATGRNPHRKRSSRKRRSSPGSAGARRRRLSRTEVEELSAWFDRVPAPLVANLYRGLGGQPHRVATTDRMVQLTVRAIAQETRLTGLVHGLQERDRKALAALLQAGGVALAEELHRELSLSLGSHERDWARTLSGLASRGIVFATDTRQGQFFYVVPQPLVDGFLADLGDELTLPVFDSDDVRVVEEHPFSPPLGFSITSLSTYIVQYAPRFTQRHEIYRHDKLAMDEFFSQLWTADSELFSFHLDFLLMHGLVELRGEYLTVNRDVMDEWLQLEPEDQRDLLFRALDARFPMAEWILWALQGADGWVAERPLMTMYRRWKRGEDWRRRYQSKSWSAARAHERESYSFAPLVHAGILEMGRWGQEKFYRLAARGQHLLEPEEDDGFRQFYLTPAFEIMAPAGLAPVLLFRIGELAELTGCDRANTYKITEVSIERALEAGWRRDDILQFLRDNSQIGLPDNVEATIKSWIGHRGDVEFHEVMLMTVHRSQIRRLEGNRRIKPYLLHRFAPGMYAVDASKRSEIEDVLGELRFQPASEVRQYPGDPAQVGARAALNRMVTDAREAAVRPTARGADAVPPEALHPVPGTRMPRMPSGTADEADEGPMDRAEIEDVLEDAISRRLDVELTYDGRAGLSTTRVEPHRRTFRAEAPVLVGLDRSDNARHTYLLERVVRVRVLEV